MSKELPVNHLEARRDKIDTAHVTTPEITAHVGVQRAAWLLGGFGVLLICAFDLGPPLPFNDDWGFAWNVRHFNPLHIHLYPSGSALALVQITWAWAVTLGHTDQRLLRLSIVPFVLLAMYALHRLARRAGADRTWSAIAAISPLAFPVFTADATTFMTDAPYVALLLMATLGAVRWSEGRRWVALCIAFATLATLQRQTGLMIPVAVTAVLLIYRRDFRLRSEALGLILLWGCCLAAIAVPTVTGIVPPTQGARIALALSPQPSHILTDFLFLPGMIGLSLVPFLPGLILRARPKARLKIDRRRLWATALILWELLLFFHISDIFPGNVLTPLGLNSAQPISHKPLAFAPLLYLGIEIVAVSALLAFVWRWRDWWPAKTDHSGTLLMLLAIAQFLPLGLLHYLAFDRYYIPVVLLLVPLAARAASQTTRPRLAGSLALALTALSLALYAVGEQDYQAWQVADNHAACLAYQYASPLDVYAGYENNAVYGEIPYYERTGVVLGSPLPDSQNYFSIDGPKNPIITIEFAGSNDPRPGYNYSSLASGKLVLVQGHRGAVLNIQVPSQFPNCPQSS